MPKKLPFLLLFLLAIFQSFAGYSQTSPEFQRPKDDLLMRKLDQSQQKVYVVDFENMFSQKEDSILTKTLKDFQDRTGMQMAVVTLNDSSCDAENFEDYTLDLANKWGKGQKGRNDGVLIAVSKSFRQMRIQNGAGIVPILSDQETKEIIIKDFIPHFKEEAYFQGIMQGVEALILHLEKNNNTVPKNTSEPADSTNNKQLLEEVPA